MAARGVDAPVLRKRLADLHKEAGDYRALADVLAEDATFATDKTTRATLLAQASELYVQRCDDPAAAVPLLEQARELAPDELAPKLALSSALAASRRLDEASRLLADIIASYGGRRPKERALVHHYLARVSLVAGDRARALGELDVALRIDPAHPEILHALARLAFEEGQIERADRTYRALLLVVRRPRESTFSALAVSRAEVLLELATIAEKKEDPARATEYLASAFEAARDEDSERERLFSALRVGKRHDLLARALQDRVTALDEGPSSADAAVAASELASVLGELASLHEGPLDRPEAALDARLRALSLTPDAESAREAALALARKMGTVDRFVGAARAVLDAATTNEQTIDRLLWLGRVLELDASDDRGAAAAYARAEAELAVDGAESALGPTSARSSPRVRRLGEVWRALERIHARLGDRAAQAAVLSKRIAASVGLSPEEQADPLYRLAALRLADVDAQAEGLDVLERALSVSSDLARAEALLRDALAKRPDDRELLRFFERFAREHGQRRALVDALVALAEEARRGAVPLEPGEDPLREAVDVALSLSDRPLAESILRRVLEASGENAATAWAMIALAHLVEEADNLAEAAALRERAAPHFDPEEERQLLIGVAEAATGPLADLERAARIYDALRVREPADRDLWQPLLAVVRKRGDERRLAALLEETTPLVDDAKERAIMGFERARLVAKWDERAAASLLHEVLENDPSQVEAAMQLANMLERAGEKAELAELLRKQLEAAKDREDTASIVSLSIRLGALLETQGEENEALDVYHAALDWDKGAREILRAVLRIAHARDDSMDVGDALDQLLQVEIGEAAAELALQLAQIRGDHDAAGAEKALETGYAAAPTSERVRDELVRRYTNREAWSKLAAVHVKDAESRADVAAKVDALCRAAEVLRQRAKDARGAADALLRALAVAPADRVVLKALLDAFGETGEHERAIEAVGVALAVDPEDAWLFRSRAALHEGRGDVQLALVDLGARLREERRVVRDRARHAARARRRGGRRPRRRRAQEHGRRERAERRRAHRAEPAPPRGRRARHRGRDRSRARAPRRPREAGPA